MAKTREEFNEAVLKRYLEFKEKELKKTKIDLFNDAYCIAKTESIASFLRDSENEEIEKLFEIADRVLVLLYNYEFDYDIPMWGNWDDLGILIHDFIEEKL